MSDDLASKTCEPCRGGTPPMPPEEVNAYVAKVDGWEAIDTHHIVKTYTFSNFAKALEFTNTVGAIAEEQGHHPDIALAWGKVEVTTWTHKIDGLSEADFILAAKIDAAAG